MAGVAAAFVVVIGTGYRLSGDPTPPVIATSYYGSIALLVLVVVVAIRAGLSGRWPMAIQRQPSRWFGLERWRLARSRRAFEDGKRRRLAELAADPRKRKYVELIERGESWSDDKIDYNEDRNRLATCLHLQPIEGAMRGADLQVRLVGALHLRARCRVDQIELHRRFALLPTVRYSEPTPQGRGFEDPLAALIACDACKSVIDVVHPLEAMPETPMFPAPAREQE